MFLAFNNSVTRKRVTFELSFEDTVDIFHFSPALGMETRALCMLCPCAASPGPLFNLLIYFYFETGSH